jgi:thiaminase/transcriptional activator TenA
MRYTEQLRQAHAAQWQAAVDHRFVRELLAGTIEDAVMRRYLVQDHRFIDAFLTLLGAAIASADQFSSRLRLGRFVGVVSGEENTYFLRAFQALGVDEAARHEPPDHPATAGFKALMRQAAATGSYAVALAVLNVAEGLYLDWAQRAQAPLPSRFVHAEWITLHDNPDFAAFVAFLRDELDRVGPADDARVRDFFQRALDLELAFFDAAYATGEAA